MTNKFREQADKPAPSQGMEDFDRNVREKLAEVRKEGKEGNEYAEGVAMGEVSGIHWAVSLARQRITALEAQNAALTEHLSLSGLVVEDLTAKVAALTGERDGLNRKLFEACNQWGDEVGDLRHRATAAESARDEAVILVGRLHAIVRHCWVHSGYRDCGSDQMDTQMRHLYRLAVSGEPDAKLDMAAALRPASDREVGT